MDLEKTTSIRLHQTTVDCLKELGKKGESYDLIILWLLNNCKKKR